MQSCRLPSQTQYCICPWCHQHFPTLQLPHHTFWRWFNDHDYLYDRRIYLQVLVNQQLVWQLVWQLSDSLLAGFSEPGRGHEVILLDQFLQLPVIDLLDGGLGPQCPHDRHHHHQPLGPHAQRHASVSITASLLSQHHNTWWSPRPGRTKILRDWKILSNWKILSDTVRTNRSAESALDLSLDLYLQLHNH